MATKRYTKPVAAVSAETEKPAPATATQPVQQDKLGRCIYCNNTFYFAKGECPVCGFDVFPIGSGVRNG